MRALEADDPRQVGAYRLLRRLGAGGMGRVYLGRTAGGRTVAVKVVRGELADDAEFRARFRREVAAARRVGGTWTAPVLDADTEGPQPWVATGYVAGPALGDAVRESGPLPEPSVRALGVGLAEALGHVHGLGLVHRDVKPSNVLLTLDGPRLIDFGIARALDATSGLTQSGYVVGSPGFMSPEQANGLNPGPAGDVFSLGAVLAFASTGIHPFGEGVSAAVLLYRVLHEEPDVSGLTGPLRATILRCLAKDPANRPSPRQLRILLDPDGSAAGRLAQGAWLPSALAAGVGRAAVGLLDLEGEGPAESPVASGADAGSNAGSGTGFSGTAPGEGRRRGARSGVVAVVCAAAVALLAGGGYGLYAWLHRAPAPVGPLAGPTTTVTPQPAPVTSTASASASGSSSPSASTGGGAVPASFVGTWRGDMVTEKGLAAGTTTVTVRPVAVGQEGTTSRNALTGLISISCDGAWTLKSVSEGKLVFQSRLVHSSIPGACTSGSNAETLTLQGDGTLRFTSADPGAGNPSGTLHKVDGGTPAQTPAQTPG
ncbi:serine/threonine-protein kinase [Kitasatospora sp. NPDC101183]|uniref:serine/threonine-protein kinase n=1 Tax=Kitasatospora sp. NPDC101183 TaxID=3364100 RepID=UPI00381FD1CB